MAIKEYSSPYGLEGVASARSIARHIALSSLAAVYRATGLMAHLSHNRVQFLYLHHLFPDEEAAFRQLLCTLSRDHCFISYSEAVDRILQGRIDKPYLCLSFDDGLRCCLRAAKILREFGVSGCFFICPSMVGETDRRRLEEYCVQRLSMPATELLSWDDVEAISKDGHEIGSHTMAHSALARIPDQHLHEDIHQSREWLVDRMGYADHFAWPEGRFFHFSGAAARAVIEAGFKSCASAERGCHVTSGELQKHELCIRRDYIAAKWPLGHILYFMARNSLNASTRGNRWPDEWLISLNNNQPLTK